MGDLPIIEKKIEVAREMLKMMHYAVLWNTTVPTTEKLKLMYVRANPESLCFYGEPTLFNIACEVRSLYLHLKDA